MNEDEQRKNRIKKFIDLTRGPLASSTFGNDEITDPKGHFVSKVFTEGEGERVITGFELIRSWCERFGLSARDAADLFQSLYVLAEERERRKLEDQVITMASQQTLRINVTCLHAAIVGFYAAVAWLADNKCFPDGDNLRSLKFTEFVISLMAAISRNPVDVIKLPSALDAIFSSSSLTVTRACWRHVPMLVKALSVCNMKGAGFRQPLVEGIASTICSKIFSLTLTPNKLRILSCLVVNNDDAPPQVSSVLQTYASEK